MDFSFPSPDRKLGADRIAFLDVFKKACKRTILEMLKQSQSGHPGGSLSSLDILSTLYAFRLPKTNERIVVSNGHISSAVYAILAEMGVVEKEKVIKTFRQIGSQFEGHVTRQIPGIFYGTGPLGIGFSVAGGMALADKLNHVQRRTFALMGDGECDEGIVHEAILLANKYQLSNFTVFVDYNRVQLTGALQDIMPINVVEMFRAQNWNVLEIDGHDPEKIWDALSASDTSDKPTAVICRTIMGHGVKGIEEEGMALRSTWHGKCPLPVEIDTLLKPLTMNLEEEGILEQFREYAKYAPAQPEFVENLKLMNIDTGTPFVYAEPNSCRHSYGEAIEDLAKRNKNIVAGSADLRGSVETILVAKSTPLQHLEFGICEQNMVSACGGISLSNLIPFCSTFGAFMTSRAKDQARVNDINRTNVKMVATHCGLSVGEDGPTHQAIDDMGSFAGFFNTHVCEPADANHCDRIIRYAASHYGNFYVRMGRHVLPILKREDGTVFFDKNYKYEYGKCDLFREGSKVTIVASGACVAEALKAREATKNKAEIVIVSSPKKFDDVLETSLRKTKNVIVVEDHNSQSGYASGVCLFCAEKGIALKNFQSLSVKKYQLSGKVEELYHAAGIDSEAIAKAITN